MSANDYQNSRNTNKVVVTKLQGGYHPVNAPLATQPQTMMSVQNNAVSQQGGNTLTTQPNTNGDPMQPQMTLKDEESVEYDDYDEDEDENEDASGMTTPRKLGEMTQEELQKAENVAWEDEFKSDASESNSSVSTTELLGRDPLYLVLSSFLSNEEGENIVDVLNKINRNLAKLVAVLDKDQKDDKKNKVEETNKSNS